MLERIVKTTAAVLLLATALPGCSMLTAQGRQQRAYERYVRKCGHRRDQLQAKMMKAPRIPTFAPSEPKTTTELGGSPKSVTSSESEGSSSETAVSAESSN
jgi:hypothetical protein